MRRMTLREAAEETSRSITTLRRYIRGGRLRAEMRTGRYGPEYFVSPGDLADAGLPTEESPEEERHAEEETSLVSARALAEAIHETVPQSMYQELQMKHEQLLVQYGMMRAGGLRALELQGEVESQQERIDQLERENGELMRRLASETEAWRRKLREAELELEGKRQELAAIGQRVRSLEIATHNSVTNEHIERQFSEVMSQIRRVERMGREREEGGWQTPPSTPGRPLETDH